MDKISSTDWQWAMSDSYADEARVTWLCSRREVREHFRNLSDARILIAENHT